MKILVGSQNPVKIEATEKAFEKFFDNIDVKGANVDSEVSNQPFNEETFKGAENRAKNLMKYKADFYVGIEGGVIKLNKRWFSFGVVCIKYENKTGFGTTPLFEIKDDIIMQLKSGKELGNVMDEIMHEKNTKQKGGAVSYFTNGRITRTDFYIDGVTMALVPFLEHKK